LTSTIGSTFGGWVAVKSFRKIRPAATVTRLWHSAFGSFFGRCRQLGATLASLIVDVAFPDECLCPADASTTYHFAATVLVLPALVGFAQRSAHGSVIGPQLHAHTGSGDFGERLHRHPAAPLAGAFAQVADVEQSFSGQRHVQLGQIAGVQHSGLGQRGRLRPGVMLLKEPFVSQTGHRSGRPALRLDVPFSAAVRIGPLDGRTRLNHPEGPPLVRVVKHCCGVPSLAPSDWSNAANRTVKTGGEFIRFSRTHAIAAAR